jgi:cysteine sulfinate desulfinase/cysteine desulfurase-like protein
VSVFKLNFPTTRASVLQDFRVHVDALSAELQVTQRKIGNGTQLKIVAIIDSIASLPGVYLPWKEMVAICRERSILTVVDAAHSVGQEPNINLSEAGPDFWVSVRPIPSLLLHVRVELCAHRTVTSGSLPSVRVLSYMYQKGTLCIRGINKKAILWYCLETSA